MSAKDKSLEKYFNGDSKGAVETDRSLEYVIEWLRKMKFFENTSLKESDVRAAHAELHKKTKKASITFNEFLVMLSELAKKAKKDVEEFKLSLIQEMEKYDATEKRFKEDLERGKATLQQVFEWIERNEIFDQAKLVEADVKKAFGEIKQAASITKEDLARGMSELAAKYNIDLEELKKLIDLDKSKGQSS